MSAIQKADEVARAILESGEYRNLIQSKQTIDKNNDSLNKIKDLRSRQFDYQASISTSIRPDKNKEDNIKRYYDEITKNAEIKRYLDAEKRFNELIGKVFQTISDKIDGSLK